MAQPLVIPIVRDPEYTADERVVLRVNGVALPDRVLMWDQRRRTTGEGYGTELATGEGFGAWVPYGEGIEGYGWDGQGASVLSHRTLKSFTAGDYEITGQGVDFVGNGGEVSPVLKLAHRPAPPPVRNVRVGTDGTINFEWSDP